MTDIDINTARQPRRRPRVPEIRLPGGDALIPRADFCDELGVTERTARRWNFPTTYVGGVAFVQRDASLQIIAGTVHRRNQKVAERPRGRPRRVIHEKEVA